MRKISAFSLIILISCSKTNHEEKINEVLDSLHYLASMAEREQYIGLFSKDAVFFGTDINERWPIGKFDLYVKSRFDTGVGWTYKKNIRNIFISKDKKTAWFDEIVVNESYGAMRGTGVLIYEKNEWKISQYNLLLPIPNEYLQKYAKEIKKYYEKGNIE